LKPKLTPLEQVWLGRLREKGRLDWGISLEGARAMARLVKKGVVTVCNNKTYDMHWVIKGDF
jgi:hypothetical protein